MRLAESINSSRRQRGKRAFTLVELLVVIALIALLLTVMVPVILKFLKGRGLAMAGNNISGFFAYARAEALNSRLTHIIVMYPEQDEYATGGGGPPVKIGPGMGLFRYNPDATDATQTLEFVKQFDFADQVGGDITYSKYWLKQRIGATNQTEVPRDLLARFDNRYMLILRTDGRVLVPNDVPGYILDLDRTDRIDADVVLTDGEKFVFIDINSATGATRRSPTLDAEDLDSKYTEPEKQ